MMNSLLSLGSDSNHARMTSKEIAELVESRHADVKRSIERLAKREVIVLPPTAFSEEINNLGFTVKHEYYLFEGEQGKRDSIVVVAQLSPEFTARLVDRWAELEQQLSQQVTAEDIYKALWQRHRKQAATQYTRLMEAYKDKLKHENPDISENTLRLKIVDEAEFINKITHGLLSWRFKSWLGVGAGEGIRDHMPDRLLEAITVVEQQNFSLLMADIPRAQRWDVIDQYLSASYPEVVAFRTRQEARLAEIETYNDGEKHPLLHPKDDPNLSSYGFVDSLRLLTPKPKLN